LAGNQLFGDLQRHALHVGEKQASGQTDSQTTSPQAVADYVGSPPFPNSLAWSASDGFRKPVAGAPG
jgi:hypothetical protein